LSHFSRQLFVFRKSTCWRSASSSRKNFLCYQGIVKRIGICDNLAEARNPIPGSGPCQVTGIFSLDENQWSTLLIHPDNCMIQ
jgi:hypothetical protein